MEEIGWGQFEMIIRINLRLPFNNSNIEMNHSLKFHPSKSSKQPYVSQSYDEIVLNDCPQEWISRMQAIKNDGEKLLANPSIFSEESHELIKQFNNEKKIDLRMHDEVLSNALEYVNEEIRNTVNRITEVDKQIQEKYGKLVQPLTKRRKSLTSVKR